MTTYDTLSRWYDWLAASERPHSQAGLAMLDVQPDESVLEIGCGTGHAIAAMERLGASVNAVDLSWGMVQVARGKVSNAGLLMGNGMRLPFGRNQFDAIFMSFTLELFESPSIVLAECRRVLQDNGRLGIVSLQRRNKWPVHAYDWVHRRWPVWVDCRPIQVCEVVEEAGFRVVDSAESSMWGLPVTQLIATRNSPL
jgi:demethylmenaquinone methyltransferase/2-methoxy-6-polyprenyl-1,4-benzoquinol methylase